MAVSCNFLAHILPWGAESRKLFKKKFARKDARRSGNSGRLPPLDLPIFWQKKSRLFKQDISLTIPSLSKWQFLSPSPAKCSSRGSSLGNERRARRQYRKRGPARCQQRTWHVLMLKPEWGWVKIYNNHILPGRPSIYQLAVLTSQIRGMNLEFGRENCWISLDGFSAWRSIAMISLGPISWTSHT